MKKKNFIMALLAFVILFNITGCSNKNSDTLKPASTTFTVGESKGSNYKNDFFGLSLKSPNNWFVQDGESIMKMINTKNYNTNNSRILFAAFQYPLGTQVAFNSNFICLSEKKPENSSSISKEECLQNAKEEMLKSNSNCSFDKDIYEKKIDGISFDVMETSLVPSNSSTKVFQKTYLTIAGDYALSFTITYNNDEQLNALNKVIDSIKFSR